MMRLIDPAHGRDSDSRNAPGRRDAYFTLVDVKIDFMLKQEVVNGCLLAEDTYLCFPKPGIYIFSQKFRSFALHLVVILEGNLKLFGYLRVAGFGYGKRIFSIDLKSECVLK